MLVRPLQVEVRGDAVHCPVLSFVDRRSSRARTKEWLLTKAVERILYGPNQVCAALLLQDPAVSFCVHSLPLGPPPSRAQRTTGAFHMLLQRNSFDEAVLVSEKAKVDSGTLTAEEHRGILDACKPLVDDVEARNRIKRCSVVPVSVVTAACAAFGRCAQTVALLRALKQLPRVWELQLEQEALRARLEFDLQLDEELQELDEEGVHLAAELHVMPPYAGRRDDDEAATSWKLPKEPAALTRELEAYAKHRAEPINRFRDGSAVVDVTVGNDRATCLRFLGWLLAEKQIAPGLGVFGKKELADWVEAWVQALAAKGVLYSSLSNYTNSLIALTNFVYTTYAIDEGIRAMHRTPLDDLVGIRGQCESEAKQQRLFQRRDPNWIDWPDAQRARQKAEAAACASSTPLARREWLILALHTCIPPDRVGVIRKLRLNASLKRQGDGFVLDLTQQRSHKTSRFYGPSVTTLSPLLTEPLRQWLTMVEYDAVDDPQPYLFHVERDTRRCVASSQWSAMVKAAFKKHAGVACPPKLLRSSFVTWLKDSVQGRADAPEILKAAAKAMRHKEETQGSDKYDKASHDRLAAAATQYLDTFARTFAPSAPVATPAAWALVPGQPPSFSFVRDASGQFVVQLPWWDALQANAVYRWAVVPGLANGLTWRTPEVAGKTLTLAVRSEVTAPAFCVTHLLMPAPAEAPEPASAPSAPAPPEPAYAPTEVVEHPPVVEDEWQAVEGEYEARRESGARFVVPLPAHPLLVPGAEVRFLRAARADMAEQVVRLPAREAAVFEVPLRLDVEGDVDTLSGLEVRAPPPAARASLVQPPLFVASAHAALHELHFARGEAARNGDCVLLSMLAGFEIRAIDAAAPPLEVLERVTDVRAAAVDLLVGAAAIGGIEARVVRECEDLPAAGADAEVELADWRRLGFWQREGAERCSSAFTFALATHLERPAIVLETRDDVVLDPCVLYAERRAGALVTTPARGTTPETIPFLRQMPWKEVLATLAKNPRGCSVLEYDRAAKHFSPWLFRPPERSAPAAPAAPPAAPAAPATPTCAPPRAAARGARAPAPAPAPAPAARMPAGKKRLRAASEMPPSRVGRARKPPALFDEPCERAPPLPPPPEPPRVFVPAFCTVGARIKALGWRNGEHKPFLARVAAIRACFPRILVVYEADEHGATLPLALPAPRTAYVHAGMVAEA